MASKSQSKRVTAQTSPATDTVQENEQIVADGSQTVEVRPNVFVRCEDGYTWDDTLKVCVKTPVQETEQEPPKTDNFLDLGTVTLVPVGMSEEPSLNIETEPLTALAKPTGNRVLRVKKVRPNAVLPSYATENSAMFDLYACLNDGDVYKCFVGQVEKTSLPVKNGELKILSGHRYAIPLGLKFHIPEGYYLKIVPRSGIGLKLGLYQTNSYGVIDPDYPNEVFLLIGNNTGNSVTIKHGERFAQATLQAFEKFDIVETDDDVVQTTDRVGGLGHTGK